MHNLIVRLVSVVLTGLFCFVKAQFREKGMIEDTGIGRVTYHKLKKDIMQ